MYKHIFKDQRHNSINFDASQLMLDSQIDFSDIPSRHNRESVMSKKTFKSRQGTADIAHYSTEVKGSHLNSPRGNKLQMLSQRSGSINILDPKGYSSVVRQLQQQGSTIYGGNKFHSGASNYDYQKSSNNFGAGLGLSPNKMNANGPSKENYNKSTISQMNNSPNPKVNFGETIKKMNTRKLNKSRV